MNYLVTSVDSAFMQLELDWFLSKVADLINIWIKKDDQKPDELADHSYLGFVWL